MVVNLQKEVLGMNQWLRRKRRICANGRQSLEVCCCERRNGSVFSVFIYDRTSLYCLAPRALYVGGDNDVFYVSARNDFLKPSQRDLSFDP
jgi:hypothetical protein